MQFSKADANWMNLALKLARRGQGTVEPNPMVGCVIVDAGESAEIGGRLIGQGWHQAFGSEHAEVNAIKNSPKTCGATAYVTLEPCCHSGKTPPCTQALIEAGINRVVVAHLDPFADVQGNGVEQLRKAGLAVDVGLLADEAMQLNAPYLRRILHRRPWVIAKWAMTLDGKIATSTGDSQWISGDQSRSIVHRMRARMDAIIVGTRTAILDDPLLTARDVPIKRKATRIVVDGGLKISLDSKLVKTALDFPTLIVAGSNSSPEKAKMLEDCGVEVSQIPDSQMAFPKHLLELLAGRSMTNVMIEGGGTTIGSFFDASLIDEYHVFVAPKVAGGERAPSPVSGIGFDKISESTQIEDLKWELVDRDLYVSGCRKNEFSGLLLP